MIMITTHNHHTRGRFVRRRGWRIAVAVVAAICCLTLTTSALADALASARGVAMGGSISSLATGVDAARCNPALLGLVAHQERGVELFGLAADIHNNALTLNDYNTYNGTYLTTQDKADILARIPTEGLKAAMNVDASALSIALGSAVLAVEGVANADLNVSRAIIELMLNGNAIGDTINLDGSCANAVGYMAFGLSYGRPVYTLGTRQVAVGATVKYIRGLGVEQMVEHSGSLSTNTTGFAGAGSFIVQTSTGGSGYTVDLGAAVKLSRTYTAGVSFKNFLSHISWSKQCEEHGYLFSFDNATVDNWDEDEVVSEDYTIDLDGFTSNLPSVMNIGFAKTGGRLLWSLAWEQGFRRAAGSSTTPRLSAGIEWPLLSILPLRTGFSTGGNNQTAFALGAGLRLGSLHIDIATITGASLSPSSAKGTNLALSTGLYF
jgi:hypothetical protein